MGKDTVVKYLDYFAGIGGFRNGLERHDDGTDSKIKYECAGLVEIDDNARKSYQTIHETQGEWVKRDITKVTAEDFAKFEGEVDLLCGGFPCAPKGTKIKTLKNYVNIEDIQVGDYVLTHENRYQKVLQVMSKEQDHYNVLKAKGVYGLKLTDEHPVYVYDPKTEETEWVDVKDLTEGMYLGININQESIDIPELSDDDLWLLGLYTADGWTDSRRDQMVIGIGEDKYIEFKRLTDKTTITYERYREKTHCHEITFKKGYLYDEVLKIGVGALNKEIPSFILNLPKERLTHFLNGYLHGDGHYVEKRNMWMFSTVSEKLALGIQDIVLKLTHKLVTISVRKDNRKETFNDSYNGQWCVGGSKDQIIVDNQVFTKLKSVTRVEEDLMVYNMEVEEDNSYTTNNVIVHNCQAFSNAGRRLGFEDTRGTLFYHILRSAKAIKPKVLFMENVEGLVTHEEGRTFRTILKALSDEGYQVIWRVVNSSNHYVPQNRPRIYIVAWRKDLGYSGFMDIFQERTTDLTEEANESSKKALVEMAKVLGVRDKEVLKVLKRMLNISLISRGKSVFAKGDIRVENLDEENGKRYMYRKDGYIVTEDIPFLRMGCVVDGISLGMQVADWHKENERVAFADIEEYEVSPYKIWLIDKYVKEFERHVKEDYPKNDDGNYVIRLSELASIVKTIGSVQTEESTSMGQREKVYYRTGITPAVLASDGGSEKIYLDNAMTREGEIEFVEERGRLKVLVDKEITKYTLDASNEGLWKKLRYALNEEVLKGIIPLGKMAKGVQVRQKVLRGILKGTKSVLEEMTLEEQTNLVKWLNLVGEDGVEVQEVFVHTEPIKLRKMTPLEYFRANGYSDEAWYKAAKVVGLNATVKQSGNSVSPAVPYEISKGFERLFCEK